MDPPSPDTVIDSFRDLVSGTYDNYDPQELYIRATALVTRLKFLNRTANMVTRARKYATAVARQDMDQSHLRLQNWLYEKRHLEREIEKCRQFASVYQDVPLYNLAEFTKLAPLEARTDRVLANEHQLMLNRLSFELAERQRFDFKKRELAQQKEDLLKETKAKQATLESVKSQIDVLVKTATEIQKKVDELVQPVPNDSPTTD